MNISRVSSRLKQERGSDKGNTRTRSHFNIQREPRVAHYGWEERIIQDKSRRLEETRAGREIKWCERLN